MLIIIRMFQVLVSDAEQKKMTRKVLPDIFHTLHQDHPQEIPDVLWLDHVPAHAHGQESLNYVKFWTGLLFFRHLVTSIACEFLNVTG